MSAGRTTPRARRGKAPAKTETDWQRLARLGDAEIAAAVAADDDTFIPDQTWWQRAQVVVPPGKKLVSLRLDADVLEWFRRHGRGYQTRINAVLRSYMAAHAARDPKDRGS